MNLIKNFSEWKSVNEGVTVEQRDKIFAEAEKWANSLDSKTDYITKVEISERTDGEGSFYVITRFGAWALELEASKRKAGEDSMYRPTYVSGENLKWYVKYPARYSQYSPRANYKSGNLKTFKLQVERFQKVYENFILIEKFLKTLGVDREVDWWAPNGTVYFTGKDLKDLGMTWKIAPDGEINYKPDSYFSAYYIDSDQSNHHNKNKWERSEFDVEKGEIFYFAALSAREVIEKAGKIDSETAISILEVLKDKPREEVWKLVEKGDWKSLADRFRGQLSGKKYGL
jgi:hypothetical protein